MRFLLPLLILLFSVSCSTSSKQHTQVRFRPQDPSTLDTPKPLPKQQLVYAVEREIQNDLSTQTTPNQALTRAEVQFTSSITPAEALHHLRVEPAYQNKTFLGHRILSISEIAQHLFSRFDNAPAVGDILISINQTELTSPDAFLTIWEALPTVKQVEFTLLRTNSDKPEHVIWPVIPTAAP